MKCLNPKEDQRGENTWEACPCKKIIKNQHAKNAPSPKLTLQENNKLRRGAGGKSQSSYSCEEVSEPGLEDELQKQEEQQEAGGCTSEKATELRDSVNVEVKESDSKDYAQVAIQEER